MRRIAVIAAVSFFGLAVSPLRADSAGATDIPDPVEAGVPAKIVPVKQEAAPAKTETVKPAAGKPVAIPDSTVTAPAPGRADASVPSADNAPAAAPTPAPNATPAVTPGRFTTQRHGAFRVNTVSVELPAGIRVVVRKDWYTDRVLVTYPESPYSDWRGVRRDAFSFVHDKDTLRILPSGTKYVPKEITITIRPSQTVRVM